MVVGSTVLILPNIYLQWPMLCVIVEISYLYNKLMPQQTETNYKLQTEIVKQKFKVYLELNVFYKSSQCFTNRVHVLLTEHVLLIESMFY